MAGRVDPFRNFRFRVEIDGITEAGFNEVSFGETSTEMVEYREGTDPAHSRKLSGQSKYGNVTLKWGTTDSKALYEWHRVVVDKGALDNRKNVSITLVDEAGGDKARWELTDCWPMKYDPTDFNAKGNDIAIETLEFVTEEYKRVT
ncbi:phage tail protein [candidate division KSB1 bacterium]|nr:phage tail protein [candidate division KSB1 bacterium]